MSWWLYCLCFGCIDCDISILVFVQHLFALHLKNYWYPYWCVDNTWHAFTNESVTTVSALATLSYIKCYLLLHNYIVTYIHSGVCVASVCIRFEECYCYWYPSVWTTPACITNVSDCCLCFRIDAHIYIYCDIHTGLCAASVCIRGTRRSGQVHNGGSCCLCWNCHSSEERAYFLRTVSHEPHGQIQVSGACFVLD